jgi:hypothetical protein
MQGGVRRVKDGQHSQEAHPVQDGMPSLAELVQYAVTHRLLTPTRLYCGTLRLLEFRFSFV